MTRANPWTLAFAISLSGCARVATDVDLADGGGDPATRDESGFDDQSPSADDFDAAAVDTNVGYPDSRVAETTGSESAVVLPSGPACNNGIDDDGDGLIDGLDPECTTPFDNDESSFAKGIPGDGEDGSWGWCKLDCAFDGNSGSGDDGCAFNGTCHRLPSDKACPYDPIAAADPKRCPAQSDKCVSYCGPRTPNGCDYAGCCDVFDSSGVAHRVRLNPNCSMKTLSDPSRCWPCEQIPAYTNPCGRCDACIGKSKLPSDCGTTCANGAKRCGAGAPCGTGEWCLTGCCIKAP